MRRLKHPIRAIREPFGTAGLIVAMIALVAALGGTALAAAKLNSTQKKEVEKIAKKFAGKPGTNGTNGSNGAAGAKGDAGAAGAAGGAGTAGANGVSVTSTESAGAIEGHCTGSGTSGKGGSKFVSASGTTYACNGKEGTTGFTSTLPSGKTETGVWAFGEQSAGGAGFVSISFPIPLPAPLLTTSGDVRYVNSAGKEVVFNAVTENEEEVEPSVAGACLGNAKEPSAAPGNLCVYTASLVGAFTNPSAIKGPGFTHSETEGSASTAGTVIEFILSAEGANGAGSWAVTAP
jgi:hypothetical protein